MTQVPARYFDGESARQVDATVQIGPENLVVRDSANAIIAVWPPERVRLLDKYIAGRPLRLALSGGDARVVIDDSRYLGNLQHLCPNLYKLRPALHDVWRPIAIWSAIAAAAAAFLFLVAIPFGAREVAQRMPPDVEARMGAEAADQITRIFTGGEEAIYCSTAEGDAALAGLTGRFEPHVELPYPLVVRVVESPLVNAITLPGGQVLIFEGLLEFVDTPEEVAGVLAHEIGHAQRRHPMEVFAKNVGAAGLIGILLGDITGGSVLGALIQFTITAAYTRDAEREADSDAIELLNAANIDASGLVKFFERLIERGEIPEFLAILNTHPASADRSNFFGAESSGTGPAMTERQWQALKTICGEAEEK